MKVQTSLGIELNGIIGSTTSNKSKRSVPFKSENNLGLLLDLVK